jgi:hypothetical protein
MTLFFGVGASFPIAQQAAKSESLIGRSDNLGIVLDLQRPSDTDVLLLRNGDKLTGTILNSTFSIRTSYASLKFHNRMIAGIDLEGGANNIEAIVTVNNNRFSGFIDAPGFAFKLQTGPQIQIRREKVLKAIFRVRGEERKGIPQRQFLLLKNGDYFSGRILNDRLSVSTTYAKVPLDLNDAESVRLIGGNNPLTKIIMRNNDTLQGVLETDDISVELDIGQRISIYQDRIDIFFCRDGFIPDLPAARAEVPLIKMGDKSFWGVEISIADKGVAVVKFSDPLSVFKLAGVEPGDVFISANGDKISSVLEFVQLRDKVVKGLISGVTFEVQRGNSKFFIKVTK